MKLTVAELSGRLDASYNDTRGFLNVLIGMGEANKTGEVRPPKGNGKGKGSTIFEVHDTFTLTM